MPETAKRTARVPILGEDGRISDDYIPAAIGENVTKAEAAATRAETAATDAEGFASAASRSAAQAAGSVTTAQQQAAAAQQSATTAGGAATSAQSAQTAAEAAKTAAETAQSAAAGSAQDAQQSATAAQQSAASVADKFISSAQATTLEPGSQATASVENQVLTIGVPKGDKGDKGDPGEKGDPGTGVPEGGAPGQLLSKTEDGTAWVDPPSTGNVLTGTATGYVAHAEDAYAQKPLEVRVKGRTVKNLWPAINGSNNGITVSTDETGLITVSGTATANANITAPAFDVPANSDFTSIATLPSASDHNESFWLIVADGDSLDTIASIDASKNDGATFNFGDRTKMQCSIYVLAGTTVNASFRVMLVEGDTAPDCFVPTGLHSVEPKKLVTAGKNLNGVAEQIEQVKWASSTEPGWSEKMVELLGLFNSLPEGEYTLSCKCRVESIAPESTADPGSNNLTGFIIRSSEDILHPCTTRVTVGVTQIGDMLEIVQPVEISPGTCMGRYDQFYIYSPGNDSGYRSISTFYDMQLEPGTAATAYEPPNVTAIPLPEVELRSLPDGTCDELVIKADGTATVERRTQLVDGAVTALDTPTTEPQSPVTLPMLPAPTFNQYHDSQVPSDTSVEYERDINIALEQLEAKIAALTVAQATS